mmetsp:Transcript_153139/g.491067  ORF Transcript_153139/g.491067 Transcript_153139/m.491067 type:complete len:342 (-) Transcript_153139:39-1064(-)
MSGGYTDAVRASRASQEVRTERDALLKRADQRTDLKQFIPCDSKDRARAILITAAISVLGMTPYVLMMLIWFFVYHESFAQSIISFFGFVALGAFFLVGSTKRAMGKDRPWMWWFGGVWLQAAVFGTIVGFFLYFRYLAYYWKYEEMRTYTNVAAAQDSSSFGDGSMFLFSEDTRLDAMRSIGYRSRWTGETFCVAPLTDVSMNQANTISFFAIGEGCCTPRAEFLCDDAGDFTTRSALRVLEPEDVVRPFMRWAVQGASFPKYIRAVKLQEATYATKAASKPTLLIWTKDPIKVKDSFYHSATEICIQVSLVYFAVVIISVYFVSWKLIPKQKHEGVIRH